MRITARSVSGSSPIKRASKLRPSESVTPSLLAPCTTWLLVKIKPSGVNTKPEPLPRNSAGRREEDACRLSWLCLTSILTTDGLTFSAAAVTAREYASSKPLSDGGCAVGSEPEFCGFSLSTSRRARFISFSFTRLEIQLEVKHAKVGCKAPRSTTYVPRHVSVISREIRDRVFGKPQLT